MINQELVFVHIPKTGGSSIGNLLKKTCPFRLIKHTREKDLLLLYQYKQKYNPHCFSFTFVRNPWDRIVSAYSYLIKGGGNLGDKKDRDHYLSDYDESNFEDFIVNELTKKRILKQLHFIPQYQWISDNKGNLVVDFVGKLEDFEKNMNKLFKEIDINVKVRSYDIFKISRYSIYIIDFLNKLFYVAGKKTRLLPYTNPTKHKNYRSNYNKKTRKIVADVYKKDIKLFGYKF